MTEVRVRLAGPDDWPAVAELLVELGRGVAKGTAEDQTHRPQFAGHLRRLEVVSLAAERGERIVGVLDMEYHQRLGDHRPQARVNDIVVTEAERGEGVGRLLLSRAEELARKRAAFGWPSSPRAGETITHRFYRREDGATTAAGS